MYTSTWRSCRIWRLYDRNKQMTSQYPQTSVNEETSSKDDAFPRAPADAFSIAFYCAACKYSIFSATFVGLP